MTVRWRWRWPDLPRAGEPMEGAAVTTICGRGGFQFGLPMGDWRIGRTPPEWEPFGKPGPVHHTAELTVDFPTVNGPACWLLDVRPGDLMPWLVFTIGNRSAVLVGSLVEDGCSQFGRREAARPYRRPFWEEPFAMPEWAECRFSTVGGWISFQEGKPDLANHPDLLAMLANHMAAVRRGDSLLPIIADWFLDRDDVTMEQACRRLHEAGSPEPAPVQV